MTALFPGMDPWLESPLHWGDFHNSFAAELRNQLNSELPAPYYAKLEMRPEIGVVFDSDRRKFSHEVLISDEEISHYFVEIRDARQNHRLVTLIEILSPSNKRPGPDRVAYERKQYEILGSDAHLIEIDLLRSGERVLSNASLAAQIDHLAEGRPYVVLINRARNLESNQWRSKTQVFAVGLRELLPVIPIPLGPGVPEPTLDLQYIFHRVYDAGPYRRGAVDYRQPPDPPLGAEDALWAQHILRSAGVLRDEPLSA
ncbi:MAG: DUF4058 family protein [Planctomycetaceae bacterium]|nr:MAG: DUF4058 family protein [Planctomycetaceae bacterium]